MADRAPKRSYIAMRAYNNDIFSYTTRVVNDFETVGVLGAVTGANAGNCPQGRILTETGRKLYPGANPGITHLMVGVFDYATGLSGFIDPNSAAFTPQNTDRPYYFTSPGANTVDPDPDRAPPVFTRGDVLAQGNFDLSGSAHIYGDALVNSDLTVDGRLYLNTGSNASAGIIDMSGGSVDPGLNPSYKRYLVTTNAYNSTTSLVFLTLKGQTNTGVYSAEPATSNSFKIVSTNINDASIIQWMVIN